MNDDKTGKIVHINPDGRGSLVDSTYYSKGYNFTNGHGYEAGQYVIYQTDNLNPITGYADCKIVAPRLWEGIYENY